jgi:hypothetical protein
VELVALQSVVCGRVSASIGFPDPASASSFPTRPRGVPPAAVPHHFRDGFILSCAFTLLQSSTESRPAHRPGLTQASGTSLGVPPLIATSAGGVHIRGRPKPASFRPRRFARPRRLPPPPALRVYFTPLPRPGSALQGFSLATSRTGSSPAVALLSFTPAPYRGCPRRQVQAPASRAFLRLRVRRVPWGFSPRPARSLPELLLLRVLLHVPRGRLPALSVHSLANLRGFTCATPLGPTGSRRVDDP